MKVRPKFHRVKPALQTKQAESQTLEIPAHAMPLFVPELRTHAVVPLELTANAVGKSPPDAIVDKAVSCVGHFG